jgi:hypothetical protein
MPSITIYSIICYSLRPSKIPTAQNIAKNTSLHLTYRSIPVGAPDSHSSSNVSWPVTSPCSSSRPDPHPAEQPQKSCQGPSPAAHLLAHSSTSHRLLAEHLVGSSAPSKAPCWLIEARLAGSQQLSPAPSIAP